MEVPEFKKPFIEEEHCRIVATVSEFSTHSFKPGECVVEQDNTYYLSNLKFELQFTIYPNGYDSSAEGSVSVVFQPLFIPVLPEERTNHFELTCTIAVADAEGGRRFPRSFVFFRDFSTYDDDPNFVIGDYISRGDLMKGRSELLPDDTLTLWMDVTLREHFFEDMDLIHALSRYIKLSFKSEMGPDGLPMFYLALDSLVALCLAEESLYFERLLDTPMMEGSSRYMRIPAGEYRSFRAIGNILWKPLCPTASMIESVDDVFDLYVTADKYGIADVIETCRLWLRLCVSLDNVSEISEFADMYDDDCLRETVGAFLKNQDEQSDVKGDAQSPQATAEYFEWKFGIRDSKYDFHIKYPLYNERDVKNQFDFYS